MKLINPLIEQLACNLKTLQRNTAFLHLTAGAVMISFSGVWVKVAHVPPTVSAFYRVLFGGIFILTAAFFLGIEAGYSGDAFIIPDIQSWSALVLLGLTTQAIGWVLISNALPRIRASLAGLILLLQPSLAFVWDVLLFQRETSPVNWIGVIMAITAIYLGMAPKPDDT